ncbi:unnamed protein product [Closterium sp. NIES-53]
MSLRVPRTRLLSSASSSLSADSEFDSTTSTRCLLIRGLLTGSLPVPPFALTPLPLPPLPVTPCAPCPFALSPFDPTSVPRPALALPPLPLAPLPLVAFPLSPVPLPAFPLALVPLPAFPLAPVPLPAFPLAPVPLPLPVFPLAPTPRPAFPAFACGCPPTPVASATVGCAGLRMWTSGFPGNSEFTFHIGGECARALASIPAPPFTARPKPPATAFDDGPSVRARVSKPTTNASVGSGGACNVGWLSGWIALGNGVDGATGGIATDAGACTMGSG